MHKITSQNCQSCGVEKLSHQISSVKIDNLVLDVCTACKKLASDYKKISKRLVTAQDMSPNITVEPFNQILNDACEILKIMDPRFFVGVTKIVAGTSSNYGFVSSEASDILHVNIQRITSESGGNVNSLQGILAAIGTIAHERAHSGDYKDDKFPGGESIAEASEKKAIEWVQKNSSDNRVSRILSKYK